ncbi:MAG: hypothetical protein KIT89_09560 [Microcella sp.]|uniref:hypothetical protein n=1 Tax=Microcella sp. TaxID=1913979 RepID=UPI0024CA0589|nr:hypothetical protein [Microcella sp.]UYN82951.1 MAG: hypothetical protein KIT89_09560 [Microcella sp.]
MTTDARSRTAWRDHPAPRVLGSALGWFGLALALTLLVQATAALSDLGGFCARGGAFEITVECTDAIDAFLVWPELGGLVAVGASLLLTRGFGTPVAVYAWTAVFLSLGGVFARSFVERGDWSGLIIAVLFALVAIAPLAVVLPVAPQRLVLGRVDVRGHPFSDAHLSRPGIVARTPPAPPGENPPSAADWLLSLGIVAASASLGIALGSVWFTAATTL